MSDKHTSSVLDVRHDLPRLFKVQYEVLRRVVVGEFDCFLKGTRFHDKGLCDGFPDNIDTREGACLDVDFRFDGDEVHGRKVNGDEHDLRVDAVLSLGE